MADHQVYNVNSFISPSPRDSNLGKKNYNSSTVFFAILNLKCKGKDKLLHRIRAFFNV